MESNYDPKSGHVVIRDMHFQFKDVVTSIQFDELKKLRIKNDKIERDGLSKLSEEEVTRIESEWYEAVFRVGLENETYDTLRQKLTEGEIRGLAALVYNFLWMFGSIAAAKQYYDTLVELQKKEEKS